MRGRRSRRCESTTYERSLSSYDEGATDTLIGTRQAILDGDIDKAIKFINTFYPTVLPSNSEVYFKLRSRKFVEMMRQSTELLDAYPEKRVKSMNGNATAISEDGFDPDMDVDEPMKDGDDWEKMDTEEPENGKHDNAAKYDMLLTLLIQYGQELKDEFKDDRRPLVISTFTDMFSMFSYPDPRKSPHGKLLDLNQRVLLAETVNSAILGTVLCSPRSIVRYADNASENLGRSRSTAIERLYKETSVLVDSISWDGGPGAFVNLRDIIEGSSSFLPEPL